MRCDECKWWQPVRSQQHNPPQPKHPKTCRECVYCGEPTDGSAACCHDLPKQTSSGHAVHPPRVGVNRPACHVGILSDSPWPDPDLGPGAAPGSTSGGSSGQE